MSKQVQSIAQPAEPLGPTQTATVGNASARLRMLSAGPPDIDGPRETALRTTPDVKRAQADWPPLPSDDPDQYLLGVTVRTAEAVYFPHASVPNRPL